MKLVSLSVLTACLSLWSAPGAHALEKRSYSGVLTSGHGAKVSIPMASKLSPEERRRQTGRLYRAYLDFFVAYETRHPETYASRSFMDWVLNDAWADEGSCMLAGFVGVKSGGRCKPAPGSDFNSLRDGCKKSGAGTVPCNPEIFGEGLCVTPKDSRWTKTCEQAAVEAAGGNDAGKLGKYVETKKISLEKMHERMQALCAAAEASGNAEDLKDCQALSVTVQPLIEKVVISSSGKEKKGDGKQDEIVPTVEPSLDSCPYCHLIAQNLEVEQLEEIVRQLVGGTMDGQKLVFDPETMKDCGEQNAKAALPPQCYQTIYQTEVAAHLDVWFDVMNETHQPPRSFRAETRVGHCDVAIQFEADRSQCPLYTYLDGTSVPVCMTYRIKDRRPTGQGFLYPVVYSRAGDHTNAELFNLRTRGEIPAYPELRAKSWATNSKQDLVLEMTQNTYAHCSDLKK